MIGPVFHDRREAGQRLGAELATHKLLENTVVLALPRGGVPVGFEVAKAIGAPLDVLVVRKLGVPWQPEVAMGAIARGGGIAGVRILDEKLIRHESISPAEVEAIAERETAEAARREQIYRADRPSLDLRNRSVILVDDGLATGSTMLAAVKFVRSLGPSAIIVAVPVVSRRACAHIREVAEDCVCLSAPIPFRAVGEWYQDFRQTSDAEVRDLLDSSLTGETAARV